MQFTLDSITLVQEILKEKFKCQEVISTPFITTKMEDLQPIEPNIFYFGVLTVNGLSEPFNLADIESTTMIQLDPNSQISALFRACFHESGLTSSNIQFYGYQITLKL